MVKNIIIISTPRCGGTAYAKMLSEEYGMTFINEPFKLNFRKNRKDYTTLESSGPEFSLGGGIPNEGNCVVHTLISQHLTEYNNISAPLSSELILQEGKNKWEQLKSFCIMCYNRISQLLTEYSISSPKSKLILLERKNKWEQLKSFCIMCHMMDINPACTFHNYNFTEVMEVTAHSSYIKDMFFEWMLFSLFKKNNTMLDLIYYEDIQFSETLTFQKNKGYENVTISNIDFLEEQFRYFWKYTGDLSCME